MSELRPGVVTGCYVLKVYEEPNESSDVLCEISSLTKIMIDEDESTDEFYNVCTSAGIEGYCKRDYVLVEP